MKNISWLLFFIVSFISCSSTAKDDKSNEHRNTNISIIRFDKDFYSFLKNPDIKAQNTLLEKYPTLLPAFGFITTGAKIGQDSAAFYKSLQDYFSHPMLLKLYNDATFKTFDNATQYESELTKANELINEHLPGKKLPHLAMHVSGFKENVIVLDSIISISCDKYMGSDYPIYEDFFQEYQRNQMQPNLIVRDYLKAWIISSLPSINEQATLLATMINEGKILYSLSLLIPNISVEQLMGYTSKDLSWCESNESEIWKLIIKQNDLYTDDHLTITKYIADASHTFSISPQSPGRVGCWLGLQIVKEYAEKTGTSLDNIFRADAQSILKGSKYNP